MVPAAPSPVANLHLSGCSQDNSGEELRRTLAGHRHAPWGPRLFLPGLPRGVAAGLSAAFSVPQCPAKGLSVADLENKMTQGANEGRNECFSGLGATGEFPHSLAS